MHPSELLSCLAQKPSEGAGFPKSTSARIRRIDGKLRRDQNRVEARR